MKKLILSAAVIVAMASCAQNEIEEYSISTGDAIGFSTLNAKVTRQATENYDNFKVFARSSSTTATTWYINDIFDGLNNSCTSSEVYYWPDLSTGATLGFMAYAPAYEDDTAKYFVSTSIDNDFINGDEEIGFTFSSQDGDADLTVADALTGLTSATGTSVALTFNHLLSKINFKVELDEESVEQGFEIINTSESGSIQTVAQSKTVAGYPVFEYYAAGLSDTEFTLVCYDENTGAYYLAEAIESESGNTTEITYQRLESAYDTTVANPAYLVEVYDSVEYEPYTIVFEVPCTQLNVTMDFDGYTATLNEEGSTTIHTFPGIYDITNAGTVDMNTYLNFVPQPITTGATTANVEIQNIAIKSTETNTLHYLGTVQAYTLQPGDITTEILDANGNVDYILEDTFVANRVYNVTLVITQTTPGVFDNKITFTSTVADWQEAVYVKDGENAGDNPSDESDATIDLEDTTI